MVWGAFSLSEQLPLVRLQGKQNGQSYAELIENSFFYQIMSDEFILDMIMLLVIQPKW